MFHWLRAFGVIGQRRNCQVSARTSCPVVGFWKPEFIDRTDGSSVREDGGEHMERWKLSQANPMEVRHLRWGKSGLGWRESLWCRGPCGDWAGVTGGLCALRPWEHAEALRASPPLRGHLCVSWSQAASPRRKDEEELPLWVRFLGVGEEFSIPTRVCHWLPWREDRADLIWFGELLNQSIVKGNPCLPHLEVCERKVVTTKKVPGSRAARTRWGAHCEAWPQ